MKRAALLLLTMITGVAWACSSPDTALRVDPVGPDRAQFQSVAPMLVRKCGSIECHGSHFRNLRMYGYGSERLDPKDTPETPKTVTVAEADAIYDAVIGLEPEIMRDVVTDKGANPSRLSLVRKGRNEEQHKGDQRIVPGDDADTCLLSWLASATKVDACERAACVLTDDAGTKTIGNCNP